MLAAQSFRGCTSHLLTPHPDTVCLPSHLHTSITRHHAKKSRGITCSYYPPRLLSCSLNGAKPLYLYMCNKYYPVSS